MPSGFKIKNASKVSNLQVFVSSYSQGGDYWYSVATNFDDSNTSFWPRDGWEIVAFRIPGTNVQRGCYLDCAKKIVEITFRGFDRELLLNPPPRPAGFKIQNASSISNLQVFVSNQTGGEASWRDVPKNFDDPTNSLWSRNGWETVAFRIPGTNIQRGLYLDCGGKTVEITFQSFELDPLVIPPPEPTGFKIRNASSISNLQVFISSYGKNGYTWSNVPKDFDNPVTSFWNRNGWETVAFRIPGTNIQRGWYLDCGRKVVEITFHGFDDLLISPTPAPINTPNLSPVKFCDAIAE